MIKVNLGCGSNVVPSTKDTKWINIDNFYLPDNPDFLKGDAMDIPLPDNSVDYLMCDQMLEHIPIADVVIVLWNIRRVLKKDGKAIIIVPDFEDAARAWLAFDHNQMFNPLMYFWLSHPVYGNQFHEGEFHKTPMCAGFLHYCLNVVGLTNHNISFWPRDGKVPSFEGVGYYPETAKLRNAQLVAEITK